jgi:hypothetical protein
MKKQFGAFISAPWSNVRKLTEFFPVCIFSHWIWNVSTALQKKLWDNLKKKLMLPAMS